MYELKQNFLSLNHRVRPSGKFSKISITIHSTGNTGSTAQNERDWLDNPANTRTAAWHYVVGAGIVIQAIPDIEKAWHCGEESGNRFSLGVEIVETGDRHAVLETAAEFVADKLTEYNWTLKDIKKHYDWTGKNCPRILIDKAYIKDGMDWAYFIGRVEYYLKGDDEVVEKSKIKVNGKYYEVDRILKDGTNYIKVRDLEQAGFKISSEGSIAVLATP